MSVYLVFLKIESFGTGANQSVGITLSQADDVLVNSANRLWKDLIYPGVLFGKAFCLEPECKRVSDFTARTNSIIKEQFSEYRIH